MITFNKYRFFNAEEGDDAAGASTGVADPPPPPTKTFTQKELDEQAAKTRRAYDRKMRELEAAHAKALADKEAEFEALKSKVSSPDPTDAGNFEIAQKRWEREREELKNQIAQLQSKLENEEKTRLNLQKDRLIDDALTKAGIEEKHRVLARRFIEPQVAWDELDSTYMFKTDMNNLISIDEAVQEFLPDSVKPPKVRQGGAGTQAGIPARAQRIQREIEREKQILTKLEKAAQSRRSDNSAFTAWTQQKRKVADLEKQLSAAVK